MQLSSDKRPSSELAIYAGKMVLARMHIIVRTFWELAKKKKKKSKHDNFLTLSKFQWLIQDIDEVEMIIITFLSIFVSNISYIFKVTGI